MKKIGILALVLICLFNVAGIFESFNYLEPDTLKQWIETGKPLIIVDIQVKDEFAAHHFFGSIETNAFPVKTDEQKKRILAAVKVYEDTGNDVVVVCPRGGGGAKRCYSFMKSQGVPDEKLTILKGGMQKWPYRAMLAGK